MALLACLAPLLASATLSALFVALPASTTSSALLAVFVAVLVAVWASSTCFKVMTPGIPLTCTNFTLSAFKDSFNTDNSESVNLTFSNVFALPVSLNSFTQTSNLLSTASRNSDALRVLVVLVAAFATSSDPLNKFCVLVFKLPKKPDVDDVALSELLNQPEALFFKPLNIPEDFDVSFAFAAADEDLRTVY